MSPKQNDTHIRLIHADGTEETILAPEGYDWTKYADGIYHNGKVWRYCGAIDAYPLYKEAIDADLARE